MSEEPLTGPLGLTASEAAHRLAEDGPNELPQAQRRTTWHIVGEVAREPMFRLLVAAGTIYLLLGDRGEAAMLLGFVVITMAITIVQEQRTERVLEALRDLTSPRALVVRDGQTQRIAGREVVRGDLVLLDEGDRVAADAWLRTAADLKVDESLLTGESVPVGKVHSVGAPAVVRPGGDGQAAVYAGTLVVRGQGLAQVRATGARTEVGRIGLALRQIEVAPTPLQTQTRLWVRWVSAFGLGVSVLATLLHGWLRGDWVAALLAGITLAMSLLPQEFLLILTVFMAMGAWRLSRQRVLSRRASVIETLGAATVLCTDKTGTLTLNRMQVAELARLGSADIQRWVAGAGLPTTPLSELLAAAVLASEREPFDPMERAIHGLASTPAPGAEDQGAACTTDGRIVQEYGLSPELLAMTHVWRLAGQDKHTVATKGAPEAVVALCGLSANQARACLAEAEAMAQRGLRVLAVARAAFAGEAWPATPHGFDFQLLGLVGLADPLRPSVPEAVRECRAAGIRVVMITGDHAATALAIARQAGLDTSGGAITGQQLATMGDAALRAAVARTTVFARVMPEQKLRLVEAFKANGEVAAMTGDGVNDAPSLKAAHIGIAMGGRGTDVAREAASLVLLDDDFGAIVHAVRLGRRIDDNLRKAMAFVLAVHVPIAGLSLLPLLMGWPLVFTPVHIAFLELLIDPVCSIVFEAEPEERDLMQRPPRDPSAPLFSMGLLGWSLVQGGVVLIAVAGLHATMLGAQVPEAQARAATFCALVMANIGLIVANRSMTGSLWQALTRPNPALVRMLLVTAAMMAAVLAFAPLRGLFRFAAIEPRLLIAAFGLGVVAMLVLSTIRRFAPLHRGPVRVG
ncbi:MAG: cation-translocating P-type ATPase [Ideonella sp.]|nr:cation-translocating P-type ATPase [Ideonella sp.]